MSERKLYLCSTRGFGHHRPGLKLVEVSEEQLHDFVLERDVKLVSGTKLPIPPELTNLVEQREKEVREQRTKQDTGYEDRRRARIANEAAKLKALFGEDL